MFDTSRRRVLEALGIGGAGTVLGSETTVTTASTSRRRPLAQADELPTVDRVAADPTAVPDPIDRDSPESHMYPRSTG